LVMVIIAKTLWRAGIAPRIKEKGRRQRLWMAVAPYELDPRRGEGSGDAQARNFHTVIQQHDPFNELVAYAQAKHQCPLMAS
jgi:hypothetical protein